MRGALSQRSKVGTSFQEFPILDDRSTPITASLVMTGMIGGSSVVSAHHDFDTAGKKTIPDTQPER